MAVPTADHDVRDIQGEQLVKLKLIVPAGLLMIGILSACTAAETPAAAPAGNQQAPAAVEQTQGQETGEKKTEEPLTGEIKEKAEKAALKKYPGEVKKSEYDVEKPGLLAVEIEQKSGGEVEVYLDKEYNVVGTKDETGETDKD